MQDFPHTLSLLADGHIHTKYCHHAIGEMEEYVQNGITRGLKEICFLEHMEEGVHYFETTWLTEGDFDVYFFEGKQLQEKYKKEISILLGVEVGYSPDHKDKLLQRLRKRKWDRIGVSYHFMRNPNGGFHLNLVSRKEQNTLAIKEVGCKKVLDDYFTTLTKAVNILPGTVLCHFDAALRFLPDVSIDHTYLPQIRKLLEAVKKNKMALEINTSGDTIRGVPFPADFIIKEAVAMGVPLQAGSDAHKPEDVGRNFDKLQKWL